MSDWLDAEAHADRAFEMYERGRWAEAEAELRKALSLNPDHAEWHFNLGLTLEAAGRDRDALASYERAVELIPDQPDPLVAAGIVAVRLDKPDKSVGFLREALRLDRTHEAAYAHLIDALTRLGEHDEAETTFYLAQHELTEPSAHCLSTIAESLMQRGVYERAAWCLREAIRLDPSLPRLRARLGNAYAELGKSQRALQLYLRDLREDPGNIDTLLDFGELLMDLGRLPEAAEKFRRVLELEPANVDAHVRLGQIAMQARRYERAHLEFELVMKLDADYPRIRLLLAEAMLRRGRITDAQHHLTEELDQWQAGRDAEPAHGDHASSSSTMRADDLRQFGDLLLDASLPTQAARVFEAALATDGPADAAAEDLLRRLALARFSAGDRTGGIMASRRVLHMNPRCLASIHNLALAALEDGRIDVAAGWIRRGMRINRHDDGIRRLRMRLWMAWIRRAPTRLLGRAS